MKLKTIILLSLLAFQPTFGQEIQNLEIESSILQETRKFKVFVPRDFNPSSKEIQPIFVFDSQAREVFDLVQSIIPFVKNPNYQYLVIGVESNYNVDLEQSRNKDFFPIPKNKATIKKRGWEIGGAEYFSEFLNQELFPFIENKFNVTKNRVGIGWSNGGTFLFYCLINKSSLFDAYLAVSPNLAFDDGSMVSELLSMEVEKISKEKFVYLSFANEEWYCWRESSLKTINILQSKPFQEIICFQYDDFSKNENHGTTYPISVFYGLKNYFRNYN